MKHLSASNTEILKDRQSSYLISASASGTDTLSVKSIQEFAVNKILCIGVGGETTEIIKTHATEIPDGNTVTLASNLVYSHSPYEVVSIIPFDQVEFSHSATATGDKTVLKLKGFDMASTETIYDDMTYSSGYYFIRFKETITNSFSDYSDPIPFTGLGTNTVGFVINYALKRNKLDGFTKYVDYDFCISEINACLRYITGKLKTWSKLQKTNYIVGQTTRGINKISLPSDIWEDRGIKSILGIRIGTETDLLSKTTTEMEDEMQGCIQTQVTTEASAGDTTLEIDNSYDFGDTGSVTVYISGTLYTITYTGVTRSATTGVLTGVPASGDGSITVTIPVDTNVWKGESEGKPTYFTIDSDGNIVFWPIPSASYDNLNIFMDYWTGPTAVDSDTDTLDAFRFDAVKHWLTWAIKMQDSNNGERNLKDGDYIQFEMILADYIRTEIPANRKKSRPKMNGITY